MNGQLAGLNKWLYGQMGGMRYVRWINRRLDDWEHCWGSGYVIDGYGKTLGMKGWVRL